MSAKQGKKIFKIEWKKLVCSMFTGAVLSDENGELLVEGEIWDILKTKCQNPENLKLQGFEYWPTVTYMYQMNDQDEIIPQDFKVKGKMKKVLVLASKAYKEHVEQQLIKKDTEQLRLVHSIGLNNSPCTKRCASGIIERYNREGEHLKKPVIHFSRVYMQDDDGMVGVERLIENGFDLKVWDTKKMYEYLREQARSKKLKRELEQAHESTAEALSARDERTKQLIDDARNAARKRKNMPSSTPEEPAQKRIAPW